MYEIKFSAIMARRGMARMFQTIDPTLKGIGYRVTITMTVEDFPTKDKIKELINTLENIPPEVDPDREIKAVKLLGVYELVGNQKG